MTLMMTGTTATASQAAILRMAPAAAAVQAAMGPIALALGAISLAVVAVQTGMALFGDSAEAAALKAISVESIGCDFIAIFLDHTCL